MSTPIEHYQQRLYPRCYEIILEQMSTLDSVATSPFQATTYITSESTRIINIDHQQRMQPPDLLRHYISSQHSKQSTVTSLHFYLRLVAVSTTPPCQPSNSTTTRSVELQPLRLGPDKPYLGKPKPFPPRRREGSHYTPFVLPRAMHAMYTFTNLSDSFNGIISYDLLYPSTTRMSQHISKRVTSHPPLTMKPSTFYPRTSLTINMAILSLLLPDLQSRNHALTF